MNKQFLLKIKEALPSVLPLTLIVVLLNFTPLVNFTAKEIAVAASRAEATKILQELEVKKVRPVDRKKRAFAFALAAVAVAVAVLVLLL
jgi:hypothetical protein